MPWSSATRLRLKSFVRIARLRALGQGDQLRVDLGDLGHVVVDDLDRRRRFLLHPGQDLEPAPAAVATERVGAVGDVLELLEHELRDDERAVDEPGLDDLGDPAVDDRARVDDDVRVAGGVGGAVARARVAGRARSPRRRRAGPPVSRRSGRPCPARGRARRRAAATSRAGPSSCDSGKPSRRPISRPSSSPTTAVTNSAVESSWTALDQPARRDDRQVRQDREPDDHPGDDPGGEERSPAYGRRGEQPAGVGEGKADQPA